MNMSGSIFKSYLLESSRGSNPDISKMINEVYRELPRNPLNSNEVGIMTPNQDALVLFELDDYGDSVYIKFMRSTPQKSGMGTKGMDYLKEKARKFNVPLTLTPWRHGEIPVSTLRRIFTKMGFTKGKGGLYWWHP